MTRLILLHNFKFTTWKVKTLDLSWGYMILVVGSTHSFTKPDLFRSSKDFRKHLSTYKLRVRSDPNNSNNFCSMWIWMFQNALLKKKKTYSKTQQLFYKISILPKLVHICFLKHHITADVIQKSPWFIEINTLDPPAEVATTMT